MNDYLCLVVLDDDLRCLIAECKDFLSHNEADSAFVESFKTRCMTVLDEIAFLCDDTSELCVVRSFSDTQDVHVS